MPIALDRRRLWALGLGLALAVGAHSWLTPKFARVEVLPPPIESIDDPRLAVLANALPIWRARLGDRRTPVDLVCLVPDESAFFEAIARWDERSYFPILIDDGELTERFVRAYKPARVYRWSGSGSVVEGPSRWHAALRAVAGSWTSANPTEPATLGGIKPNFEGAPAMVLSNATSPMLAGAVALAAGRMQAISPLEFDVSGTSVLDERQAFAFSMRVQAAVAGAYDDYKSLGDDCDFLTLAGDYPDFYRVESEAVPGELALDDLVGRILPAQTRYAFVGRLRGDAAQSVYQAMCALFLQPESALFYNGYAQWSRPWTDYAMRTAASELSSIIPSVDERHGADATSLSGWRRTFERGNRWGLVFINSSGTPTEFNLPGGLGRVADIPASVPTMIYMIHSASAAEPDNPNTIAGRWLANGAFLYFGSMNEPYLDAFRNPLLVTRLLVAGAPFSAACAKVLDEGAFGGAWRLRLTGDPMCRVLPMKERAARLGEWTAPADWKLEARYAR